MSPVSTGRTDRRSVFPWRVRHLPLALTLGVGIVGSLFLFVQIRQWERNNVQDDFTQVAEDRVADLRTALEPNLLTLRSLAAFYASSIEVDRQEFHEFVHYFLPRFQGIQAIEWVPRVREGERQAYEAAARKDGFPDFQIKDRLSQDRMAPAARRDEYYPVYFVEPYQGNEIALGFDLASNPQRLETMRQAADSGEMAATPRIRLAQETGSQWGILVFQPIYRKGAPIDRVEDRRANLKGFALMVFRVGDLVESALAPLPPLDVDVCVYDHSAAPDARLLYHHAAAPRPEGDGPAAETAPPETNLRYAKSINLGGHEWDVECRATAAWIAAHREWDSLATLAGGLLLTGLLATYFLISTSRTERIRSLAAQILATNRDLERKIAERKQMEHELRRLAFIAQQAAEGIAVADLEGNLQFVNDAWARMHGYESGAELVGKHLRVFHTDEQMKTEVIPFNEVVNQRGHNAGEVEHVRRDGTTFPAQMMVTVLKDEQGKPYGLAGFAEDITERKRAEEDRRRLAAILEATPDFVGFADAKDSHVFYINKAGRLMTGLTPDEDVTKLKLSDVHPEWANRMLVETALPTAARDGVWTGECAFLHRDGHEIPVLMALLAHKTPSGEVEVFSTISRDITERKAAEEALREREEDLSITLHSIGDAVIATDTHSRVVRMNPVAEHLTGWPLAEAVGRPLADIFRIVNARTREPVADPLAKALATGEVVTLANDTALIARDGTERQIADSAALIRDVQGRIRGAVLVFHDVTAEYEIKKALRESEERYRSLYATSRDAIMMASPDKGFLAGNSAAIGLFGCRDEEDFKHRTPADLSPERQPDGVLSSDKAQEMMGLALEKGSHFFEWMHKRVDGTEFPATVLLSRLETGGTRIVQSTVRDITASKRAEEALRASRDRLQTITDAVADPLIAIDPDHRLVLVNRAGRDAVGGEDPVAKGLKCYQWSHHREEPCHGPDNVCPLAQVIETGKPTRVTHTHYTASGEPRFVEIVASPVLDENGKVIQVIESCRDVTERKRAEQQIEDLSRFPSENPWPIFRATRDGKVLYANAAGQPLLDAQDGGNPLVLPAFWRPVVADALESGRPGSLEVPFQDRVFSFNVVPVPAAGYANLYGSNITDRKKAEEALHAANLFRQKLLDTAATAILSVDTQRHITSVNEAFCTITGFNREEVLGKSCDVLKGYSCTRPCRLSDPDIPKPIRGVCCEVYAKDGRKLNIIKTADVLRDDSGRIVGGIESFMDVTELTTAREALEAANRQLEGANCQLEELATTDALTGLCNRRRFLEILEAEIERSRRYGSAVALAMIDVDRFKGINDTCGHAFGDRVLAEIAGILRTEARETDTVARHGGDEFLILMPDTTPEAAVIAAERIRRHIADHAVSADGRAVRVTVSAGVSAARGQDAEMAEDLVRSADQAMYAAKEAGRNCTRTSVPAATR